MKLAAWILLVFILAVPVFAADVTGKWKATTGQREMTFSFKVEGSTVTGTVFSQTSEFRITAGKIDGNNISFTVATDQMSVGYTGVVSGDVMELSAETADQTFQVTVKRMQ